MSSEIRSSDHSPEKYGFCGQIDLWSKIKILNEEMGEGIWAIRVG
jgi:hypothetical protein